MKLVVCIKQTFDTEARIVLAQNGRIDTSHVQYILNPYDEYAVEEAIRLKEKWGGEVRVVTCSSGDSSKAIQQCLAMGVEEGVIISDPALSKADAHVTASALRALLVKMDFDLILCGRVAVDDGASEVPSRLAELLDLPQINAVSKLWIEDGKVRAKQDIDGGSAFMNVPLPCVVSVQKGINSPRYPSMRHILQAKKKKTRFVSLSELSMTPEESRLLVDVLEITFPAKREKGQIFDGPLDGAVDRVVEVIKEKTKICH